MTTNKDMFTTNSMFTVKIVNEKIDEFDEWLSWYSELPFDEKVDRLNGFRKSFFEMLAWSNYKRSTNLKLNDYVEHMTFEYEIERRLKQCDAIQLQESSNYLMSL